MTVQYCAVWDRRRDRKKSIGELTHNMEGGEVTGVLMVGTKVAKSVMGVGGVVVRVTCSVKAT